MQKITAKNEIHFLISGIRGTETEKSVTINEEGVLVNDADAAIIASRFAGLVTITQVDTKEAAKAAKKALETEDEATEETEEEKPKSKSK